MAIQNHYTTLQISMQASTLEVKKAYRALARKYHPDKNSDDENATQYFQQIQAAYDILSNPIKRSNYDKEIIKQTDYNPFFQQQNFDSATIAKETEKLLNYLTIQTQKSINNDALADYILSLIKEENQLLLQREQNKINNERIVANLLKASNSIIASRLFSEIAAALKNILGNQDSELALQIGDEAKKRMRKEQQNKAIPLAAIGIVLLIIIIMVLIILF